MGMYFPGAGSYDLTGDGKADVVLYDKGTAKPDVASGTQVYEIGNELILSADNKGYVYYHKNILRTNFSEERDYLYSSFGFRL